jgi:hypothetical protein
MTRYERGFLTKCAEHGLDEKQSISLLKKKADTSRAARPEDFRWYQIARYGLMDPDARVVDTPNGPKISLRGKVGNTTSRFDVNGNRYTPPAYQPQPTGRGKVVGTTEKKVRPASTGRRMLNGAFPFLSSTPFNRPSTHVMSAGK